MPYAASVFVLPVCDVSYSNPLHFAKSVMCATIQDSNSRRSYATTCLSLNPFKQLCNCIPRAFHPLVLIAQSKVARPKMFVVSDHAVDLSVQEI